MDKEELELSLVRVGLSVVSSLPTFLNFPRDPSSISYVFGILYLSTSQVTNIVNTVNIVHSIEFGWLFFRV